MVYNTESALNFDPVSIASRLGPAGPDQLLKIARGRPGADLVSIQQQLSMHLPRFSSEDNFSVPIVLLEAERLADRLCALRNNYRPALHPWSAMPQLRSLQLEQIDTGLARIIFDRYHYLLSHRTDTLSLGLRFGAQSDWPFVAVSLSPYDLSNMSNRLPCGANRDNVMVLSRLFAFPGVPRNVISYFLGKLRSYLVDTHPHVRYLLTYVNPNVGFDGASYRADNWQLLGHELGTMYYYVDQNYRTDRGLAQEYGTAGSDILASRLGNRFLRSCHVLKPLFVFVRSVRNEPYISGGPALFPRWSPA